MALVEPDLLRRTAELAVAHLEALPSRPVGATRGAAEIQAALAAPLPEECIEPDRVVEELVRDIDGGLVASPGGRYFGFVTGGVLPAALAADWLATAWDQNAFSAVSSPALAAIEAVAADWIKDVLGLPSGAGVGFTTGAQMANVTGLAVARQVMLARAGWDVAQCGLIGAPPLTVVVGEEAHVTVLRALRLLGLGSDAASVVPSDDQGRMRADALAPALDANGGPAIVCTQAGNVNSGASDPFQEIIAIARARGAWVHVDGAFGLWAAASPELRHEVAGLEMADSWATDAHKWLNVPYDSGVAMVADAAAHRAAMSMTAAYLAGADGDERSNSDWVPEASRRGRGLAVYAALRSLGRAGVRELVERSCTLARRMAATLAAEPGLETSTTSCSTRCSSGSAATTRRPTRRSRRSSTTGRAGSAGRAGRAGPRCASRSQAGRRPRTTSTAAPLRSRPRRARSYVRPLALGASDPASWPVTFSARPLSWE